ncbi:hypothetical protein [Segetibacter aerophilus]|uniref:Hemerythrin-like domain-containing protein n=1 Tax=Segetibacter aerophilus TaxID=670293 RepID=A0A512BFS4_9BACT|nr:hypothetical protein [Segetibacter aerophilus]GEO10810.1 hypothetical protein SAE01_33060 [Segetibacter aerophilus]
MRYNIFNKAHFPLKTSLLSACVSIDKIATHGVTFAADAVEKVKNVLQAYNETIVFEGLHIFPLVFEYEPSVWNNYASEHNRMTRLANYLKSLIQSYYHQSKAKDKLDLIASISKSYNEFMMANFDHMNDEEAVLNEILWRYYRDQVLSQLEEKMHTLPDLIKTQSYERKLQIATAA